MNRQIAPVGLADGHVITLRGGSDTRPRGVAIRIADALGLAVIKHEGSAGWERRVDDVMDSNDEIVVLDVWIMRYYPDRCKELAVIQ
jgi:hypothetical protein